MNSPTAQTAQERSLQSAGCREASLLWDEVNKVIQGVIFDGNSSVSKDGDNS